jgi:hypothetical protein
MRGGRAWRLRSLLAAVVVLGLAAALSGKTPAPTSASAYPGERAAESPNRIAAEADAGKLLSRLVLPAGSNRSATQPVGSSPHLSQPAQVPGTPKLIDRAGWWTVPGSPQAVLEAVAQHPPAGSRVFEESSEIQRGVELSRSIELSWPPVAGVLASRALLLTAAAEPGGTTGLRADAQVVWIVPRPASEQIPARARVLEVDYSGGGEPARHLTVLRHRAVRRIAVLIDGLPIVQPSYPHSCPAEQGDPRTVTVTFTAAPGGRALAEAVTAEPPGNGCGSMGLEVYGKPRPALDGEWVVLRALSRLHPAPQT